MLGNAVEISLIFHRILGPLVLGWAPNHFVLGAQLAPGKKRLVCIPVWRLASILATSVPLSTWCIITLGSMWPRLKI